MLAMVAEEPIAPRELLHDAPRSLRALSVEHADGWGVALSSGDDAWQIHRNTRCAARCEEYASITSSPARVIVAHVRKKTVGELALANTHPFQRGAFVFAHNGTLTIIDQLVGASSPERRAEVVGDTDSERFFAFVLTHIDEAGGDIDRGVVRAIRALHTWGDIGSANFLLAAGTRVYAYRQGRSLFTLSRDHAKLVASEKLTDEEAWTEVPERGLAIL
jgi:predicted glutamine amidotransferase